MIEDDAVMGQSLRQSLSLEGAKVGLYGCAADALYAMNARGPDLVLCDMRLPDMNGDGLFRKMADDGTAPPFIFMTAYGDIDDAVSLMRAGAGDYLTKPFDMDILLGRIQTVLRPRLHEANAAILGVSPAMHAVERLLRLAAKVDSFVLITGETGSGKEVCARFLHDCAPPSKKPFIAVNCAAIPENLLESEIFGHEAGAFTGAAKRHLGYAERAGSGTLFLDEISELALPLQAKLLRLIEDRAFYRVGGETLIPFKARLVCASNANLESQVALKQFRADLFFRINVLPVEVPPLRHRQEDIPWLIDRFFIEFAERQMSALRGVSALAQNAALVHCWPGNVRELRNRIERAVALTLSDWIMPADLFPEKALRALTEPAPTSLAEVRDTAEKRQIERVLAQNNGQISKTAVALGVSRTTLWEKMRRLGLAVEG
ncbi:MAG: sigma-54 dependent transcriptional regulator [Hyphomicrobiales bacterium]|nr:sigma-54 dependent transcriptional regulator [Hyphomicrobiales bacterium]